MKRYLWILAAPVLAAAQVASVEMSAPALGYAWDEQAQSLRAIEGVPGSATLGGAMQLNLAIQRVVVSPNRRFALATEPGAQTLALLRLDGAIGSARRTEMPAANAFFSPSGTAAVLSLGSQLEVWTGFPEHAARSMAYSAEGIAIDRAFVSDDGTLVLALAGGRLWRLGADSPPQALGDGYADVAFLRSSHDIVAAHSSNGLTLIRKGNADAAESIVDSLEGALRIALSADERSIAILLDGSIALLDRESNQITEVALDGITVEALSRAQGNAVFQLSSAAARDIWLLDADSGVARLVAVSKGGK